ncbi:MAG TPA: cupin domain-containing protein [Cytophagaceae bacterium]|jgi:predicted cupin superfamily sugar epimerase|nr:cupin domain-containing protein [Cytophagaceae bacterium]
MNANYWIDNLNLLPHPEGGYYKETYRCSQSIAISGFDGNRNISTAIYFLLEEKNRSHFHRIQSDELWFFHEGQTLEIFILNETQVEVFLLGKNIQAGESLQVIIPAGTWFGARVKNQKGFALVSCTVAPGFDFKDFELGKKKELLKLFPRQAAIIEELGYVD